MSKTTKTGSIDPASLKIVDEAYVAERPPQGSKYDEIFSKLKQGQRLVCGAGHAGRLSQQLRVWLSQRGIDAPLVRCKEHCNDGKGGVWWLGQKNASNNNSEQEPKPKAAPKKLKTAFADGRNPFAQLHKRAA